jgi:CheY-like chemotaxis protein
MARPLKILVVEDDPAVAEVLVATLRQLGHEVCGVAHDVAELAALLESHEPNLVTLDLNLGRGRDGLGVATALEAGGPLAIVFVTGDVTPEDQEKIRATEGSALLMKPFTEAQLSEAIALALKRTAQIGVL